MANAPGFDPNDLSQADAGAPGQRGPPGRVRARLHRQGHVDGRRTGGEAPPRPRTHVDRAQPAAPRRPALQGRHRPPDLVPHAQRRARQVQQHRHHPGHRPARQDPGARPTRSSTPTCASSASAATPGSASPARPRASSPSRRTGRPRSSTRSPSARACRSTRMQAASVYSTIANGGVRDRAHPGPRHQGPRRPLHPRRRRPRKTRVVSEKTAKTLAADAGVGRRTTRRAPAPRRASPATGSRARPARPTAWIRPPAATSGYTASFAGFAPADKPADHRLLRHPEPHQGQLLRRPDLRPDLQAGHGVRPEDPPGPADRREGRPAARRLHARDASPTPDQPTETAPGTTRDDDHLRTPGTSGPAPPPRPRFAPTAGAPGTLTAVPHADQSQTTQKDAPVTYPGAAPAGPGLRRHPSRSWPTSWASTQPASAGAGHRHHP